MDRSRTSGVEHPAPVCAAGAVPLERLLRAGAGEPRRSGADAVHRRAVHAHVVLRLAADGVALGEQGYGVNRKRVQRLMRRMGLWGIAPGPRTSRAHPRHKVYPYLLRDLVVQRPNQVWSTDITYLPMRSGFMFLVAILDWYSRYVLSWGLSNTLDTVFCLEALEEALSAGRPEIFNTDQGCQFTSAPFTGVLEAHEVRISMDGRGRVFDEARPRERACLAP